MKKKNRRELKFTKDKFLQEEVASNRPEFYNKENGSGRTFEMVALASELGFSISLPIAGGAILGQFLDNKFVTGPKITLSLIFLGLFIGIANIYSILKDLKK